MKSNLDRLLEEAEDDFKSFQKNIPKSDHPFVNSLIENLRHTFGIQRRLVQIVKRQREFIKDESKYEGNVLPPLAQGCIDEIEKIAGGEG